MDWGDTNSQQVSKWIERSTPLSVSQGSGYTRSIVITSIVKTLPTSFSGEFVILVKSIGSHGLSTGQRISMLGSNGGAAFANGQTVSFDVADQMVEVLTENTFVVSFSRWDWDNTYISPTITPGNKGRVEISIFPGISLEYQIALSNELSTDGWFCVPHLADDDYVRNMAILIRDTMNPVLKAYIEYSNEVWNWAPSFVQTRYALQKAAALGQTSEDRHLKYSGQRSGEIFKIFSDIFGPTAKTRVVRVIGSQSGGGEEQLSQVGFGGADALAIAPYFGGSLNNAVSNTDNWENFTTNQILDLARAAVVSDSFSSVKSSALIAEKYGAKLIAYEGGQHMGGGGDCKGGDCSNIDLLQLKFQGANHHPRIQGLYRNMFKAWSMATGKVGGVFAAFSHIGIDSKYGSWGALQYQDDDRSTAWKYQALVGNIGNN